MNYKLRISDQVQKKKALLYNLGAIFSYASMATFLWHAILMLIEKEHADHTLVLYSWLTLISFLLMAPYKWDKKWLKIKQAIGILLVGLASVVYLYCFIAY